MILVAINGSNRLHTCVGGLKLSASSAAGALYLRFVTEASEQILTPISVVFARYQQHQFLLSVYVIGKRLA